MRAVLARVAGARRAARRSSARLLRVPRYDGLVCRTHPVALCSWTATRTTGRSSWGARRGSANLGLRVAQAGGAVVPVRARGGRRPGPSRATPRLDADAGENERPRRVTSCSSTGTRWRCSSRVPTGQRTHALLRVIAPGPVQRRAKPRAEGDTARRVPGWRAEWVDGADGYQLEIELPLPEARFPCRSSRRSTSRGAAVRVTCLERARWTPRRCGTTTALRRRNPSLRERRPAGAAPPLGLPGHARTAVRRARPADRRGRRVVHHGAR